MVKKLLILIASITMGMNAFAQTISGRVVSSGNGEPIAGASVVVQGTTQGVVTDVDGKYTLNTSAQGNLVVSLIGYKSLTEAINGRSIIDFSMEEESLQLTEVLVTALGIKREAKSVGYSAQQIKSADIVKASAPDLGSALMGKAAGLNISQSNGLQGGSQRIVIRGNNSILGSNQPLIVMDGIQVTNDPIGGASGDAANVTSPKDWGSFLNTLNPDEIEDITILKGANAAALYGARGANGVVLITSKRGGKRAGLGVDYNYSMLATSAFRFQDVQNEYGYGLASAMWTANPDFPVTADGVKRYPYNYNWDPTYSEALPGYRNTSGGPIPGGFSSWDHFSWFGPAASWGRKLDGTSVLWWDGQMRNWSPQPDNRKAFYSTGTTNNHNLSFSGGGDFGTVRVGMTRLDNKAIVPNSNYDQTNFNLGSALDISKKVKAEVNVSYTNLNRLNPRESGNDNNWTNFMIHGMSRDYIPLEFDNYKLADGSKNRYEVTSAFRNYPYNNNAFKDMFWKIYENNQKMTRNQLLGSIKLSADVTSWLNVSGRASMNQSGTSIEAKYTPIDPEGIQGEYGLETINSRDLNFELFTRVYKDKIFGSKFNTSFMLGNSALRARSHGLQAWNAGTFDIPFKYFVSNNLDRTRISHKENRNDFNLNSIFGIFDVSYNDYLYLQVTGRNDWSSTLPVATSSYFFPSASLSFVFTEALDMFKNQDVLSYGKLKFSAAQSANGTNPYLTQYAYSPLAISNTLNGGDAQSYGGLPVRSLQTVLPPAALLKPQRNKSFEIGAELAFLNGRLSTEVTYYSSKATSQILSSSVASSSGASGITFNTGELANKGVEIILRGTPVLRNDFRWDVTLNAAHNQNKVISLADGIDRYPIADLWGTAGGFMYVMAGQNYGTIYGYDYTYKNGQKVVEPIYSNTGDNKVVGTRYVTTADPVAIGNTTPKLTGGLSNNFRYKRFSLYLLTDFKIGGDLFSADYGASIGHGLSPNTLHERNGGGLPYTYPDGTTANHGVILDGVYADGSANKDVVHYMYKYAGQYMGWSNVPMPRSNVVFENSWAKLRELNLTYSIPTELVKKTGFLQGLDVSFIGRNLFYLFTTLPDNMNPEAINGIGNANGFQWAQYPATRDIGFSIKARL